MSFRPLRLFVATCLVLAVMQGGHVATATNLPTAEVAAPVPIRAIFYYPWFPQTWHAADKFHPSAGRYSSDVRTVVDKHMADLAYAGEQAVIASWWGRGNQHEQTRFPMLMRAAAAHGLRVAPYYEKEGTSDTSLATIRADLAYLKAYERANPSGFLHVDVQPVVFVYNAAATTSSCAAVRKWKQATNGFSNWYVNLKLFSGFASCPDQPSSWHQYGPASATQAHLPYSYNVSPGFYKYSEASTRLARDPARFRRNLAAQVASHARWQLVTSFNEWGEGTAVESAREWSTPDGRGSYLDAMHDAYGGRAAPTSGRLVPRADAYVRADDRRRNFGTGPRLLAGGSVGRRAYIAFANGSSAASTAVLVVTAATRSSGFVVRRATSAWRERTLTYANAPSPSRAVCGRFGPVRAGQRVSVVIDTRACPIRARAATTFVLGSGGAVVTLRSRESGVPPALRLTR